MVRVHWTVDLLEAHIVAGLLCDEGVPAYVFDADMVRQDWFKALAIGGYRVVVDRDDATRALQIVARYRAGDAARAYAADEMPTCPACGHEAVADDPRPRRAAFAVLIASDILSASMLLDFIYGGIAPRLASLALAAYLWFIAIFFFPGILAFIVRHRYTCTRCGRRFRDDRGAPFAELSAAVSLASDPPSAR